MQHNPINVLRKNIPLDFKKLVLITALSFIGNLGVVQAQVPAATLKCAAYFKTGALFQILQRYGVENINDKDRRGFTALHRATMENNPAAVQLLLAAGGSDIMPTARTGRGETALGKPIKNYVPNSFVDAKNTPQHKAVPSDNLDTIQLLMRAEKEAASKNSQASTAEASTNSADGNTALMRAVIQRDISVVIQLIKAGADVLSKNKSGQTALDVAKKHGRDSGILKILQAANRAAKENKINSLLTKYEAADIHRALLKAVAEESSTGRETNLEDIQLLIDVGADLNVHDNRGTTPLMHAARHGNVRALNLLLNEGSTLDFKNRFGQTALSHALYLISNRSSDFAARNNAQTETLRLLLEKGANPNIRDVDGNTPLGEVIRASSVRYRDAAQTKVLSRMLLEAGADPTLPNIDGNSPLSMARNSGDKEIIDLLMRTEKALPVPTTDTNLHPTTGKRIEDFTAAQGKANSDKGNGVLRKGNDLLRRAEIETTTAGEGSDVLRRAEIEATTADKRSDVLRRTEIEATAADKRIDVLRRTEIKTTEASTNSADGNTALMRAVIQEDTSVVRQLIDAGADVLSKNKSGQTALDVAKKHGRDPDILKILQAANLAAKENKIKSLLTKYNAHDIHEALFKAVTDEMLTGKESNLEDIQLLIDVGAKLNVIHHYMGATPLMLAARHGDVRALNLLLNEGSHPDIIDNSGQTALSHALYKSTNSATRNNAQLEILSLLLEKGANPNIIDRYGNTPLIRVLQDFSTHYSNAAQTKILIRILLEAEADPTPINGQGQSALSIARKSGDKEIIDLLMRAQYLP